MLRETAFVVGGATVIALGIAFIGALLWLGAGWLAFPSFLSALLLIGFGAFCIYVGRDATADRRKGLRELEKGGDSPPL